MLSLKVLNFSATVASTETEMKNFFWYQNLFLKVSLIFFPNEMSKYEFNSPFEMLQIVAVK